MKNKIPLIALAVTLAASAGYLLWKSKREPEVTYREVLVTRGDLQTSISATGTVQPENRLEIKAPVAGRMERVLVKEGDHLHKGQILAWMSSSERAAMLDASRSGGEEEVKKWEEMYKPTPVIAPIAGTLILRNVEPGQTFTGTDAILVMSDRLTVKAQVDETDIAQVRLKESATITLDAYPGKEMPAKVDQIAFEAKTVNNVTTYVVDVLPDAAPEYMRAGMTASVSFVTQAKENVLMVPSEALKAGDSGAFSVLVPSPNGPLEKPVKVGISEGKFTEILEGLAEGDKVLAAQLELGKKNSQGTNPFSPFNKRPGANTKKPGSGGR
ncbi:MAG: efflux RND transporter periplasmic adaptor subunit [Bdellovibrionota bacterium]